MSLTIDKKSIYQTNPSIKDTTNQQNVLIEHVTHHTRAYITQE